MFNLEIFITYCTVAFVILLYIIVALLYRKLILLERNSYSGSSQPLMSTTQNNARYGEELNEVGTEKSPQNQETTVSESVEIMTKTNDTETIESTSPIELVENEMLDDILENLKSSPSESNDFVESDKLNNDAEMHELIPKESPIDNKTEVTIEINGSHTESSLSENNQKLILIADVRESTEKPENSLDKSFQEEVDNDSARKIKRQTSKIPRIPVSQKKS